LLFFYIQRPFFKPLCLFFGGCPGGGGGGLHRRGGGLSRAGLGEGGGGLGSAEDPPAAASRGSPSPSPNQSPNPRGLRSPSPNQSPIRVGLRSPSPNQSLTQNWTSKSKSNPKPDTKLNLDFKSKSNFLDGLRSPSPSRLDCVATRRLVARRDALPCHPPCHLPPLRVFDDLLELELLRLPPVAFILSVTDMSLIEALPASLGLTRNFSIRVISSSGDPHPCQASSRSWQRSFRHAPPFVHLPWLKECVLSLERAGCLLLRGSLRDHLPMRSCNQRNSSPRRGCSTGGGLMTGDLFVCILPLARHSPRRLCRLSVDPTRNHQLAIYL
jgi:hypothetical protein